MSLNRTVLMHYVFDIQHINQRFDFAHGGSTLSLEWASSAAPDSCGYVESLHHQQWSL